MTQTPPPVPPPAEPSPAKPRRTRWIIGAAAVLLLLAGVGAYAMRDDPTRISADGPTSDQLDAPPRRFYVTIHLEPDVSADNKAAVEEHLRALDPAVRTQFRGVDDLAEQAAENYADNPEMLDRLSETTLPAIMIASYEIPEFDCTTADNVRQTPGVLRVSVEQFLQSDPTDRYICA